MPVFEDNDEAAGIIEATGYTVFHPCGKVETFTEDLPHDVPYETIKAICDKAFDGYLEHVRVFQDGAYTDMFVDEDGKIKGLARNEAATVIYRANYLAHNPGVEPEALDYIAGGAVLFARKVAF